MKIVRFLAKPWFIKVILLLLFFYNSGIISYLKDFEAPVSKCKKLSLREESKLNNFAKEKLERAKKLRSEKRYTKEVYYQDIRDILLKYKEKLDFVSGVEIQPIVDVYYRNDFSGVNLAYQMQWSFETTRARQMYPEVDEAILSSATPIVFDGVGGKIIKWLPQQYKLNFPLAFILLIIWAFESRSSKNESLNSRNPIAFSLLLIFYPITFIYVLVSWMIIKRREWFAEAELRRTKKNMFSFLSKDEMGQIRRFARSGTSLEVWKKQLKANGLTLNHSFTAALTVTVILSATPNKCSAEKNNFLGKFDVQIMQQLPRMCIDEDDSSGKDTSITVFQDALYEFVEYSFIPIVNRLKIIKNLFFKWILEKTIYHIPKMAIRFDNLKLNLKFE